MADKEDIATAVSSLDCPVNVVMGSKAPFSFSVIGIRRISVGRALYRTALGAALGAAREMREQGTFAFAKEAALVREASSIFGAIC